MNQRARRKELEGLFLGQKIGEGVDRKVYLLQEPDLFQYRHLTKRTPEVEPSQCRHVVKVQKAKAGRFQNVIEWRTWEAVSGKELAKWFAPCLAISPCGIYLIQKRVEPVRRSELPNRLPAFLHDHKSENFGILNGRVVCCDYGLGIDSITRNNRRLTNVKWDHVS